MDAGKSARSRGADESREFWLQMLIPGVLLVVLLISVVSFVPREVFVPSLVVVGVGTLAGCAVGILTGVRGPLWFIYGLISVELALLLLLPFPWRELALLCIPVSAIGFAMGKEIAFFLYNRRQQVSVTTWLVAGEAITDVVEAKRQASARLSSWESVEDGRFVVVLGHRRFEAWGASEEGFVVHTVLDDRDLATLRVLTRDPRQSDEIAIPLNRHGLTGWVPRGVIVPADVAEQALNGFFEIQGARDLIGWAWEDGEQAQELRFH